MCRLWFVGLLVLMLLAPGSAAPVDLRMLDWLPGDAALNREITDFFRLDTARMPYLQFAGDGVVLVNRGGAPAAIAWTPFSVESGGWRAFTLRFQARSDGPARRASALVLTERLDFEADAGWRDFALTGVVPAPSGPGALSFSLRGREGRLELRNLEMVPLSFDVTARVQGSSLVLTAVGTVPPRLQVEVMPWWTEAGRAVTSGGAQVVPWETGQESPEGRVFPLRSDVFAGVGARGRRPAGVRWRLVGPDRRPVWQAPDVVVTAASIVNRGPHPVDDGGRFPLGIYLHETSVSAVEAAASVGLNLVIMGDGPELEAAVRAASAKGVRVILEGGLPAEEPDPARAAAFLVARYGKLPLLGWAPVDEPDLHPEWLPRMRLLYEALVRLDGRLVYQANHSPSTYPVMSDATDVLAVDPYPVSTIPKPMYTAARWVEEARRTRPGTWYVQQAFAESPLWNRAPTPAEMRLTTWLALGAGARGIVYYTLHEVLYSGSPDRKWDLRKTPLWEEVRRETAEIRAAEPFLHTLEGPRPLGLELPLMGWQWTKGEERLLCVVNLSQAPARVTLPEVRTFPARQPAGSRLLLPGHGVGLWVAGNR